MIYYIKLKNKPLQKFFNNNIPNDSTKIDYNDLNKYLDYFFIDNYNNIAIYDENMEIVFLEKYVIRDILNKFILFLKNEKIPKIQRMNLVNIFLLNNDFLFLDNYCIKIYYNDTNEIYYRFIHINEISDLSIDFYLNLLFYDDKNLLEIFGLVEWIFFFNNQHDDEHKLLYEKNNNFSKVTINNIYFRYLSILRKNTNLSNSYFFILHSYGYTNLTDNFYNTEIINNYNEFFRTFGNLYGFDIVKDYNLFLDLNFLTNNSDNLYSYLETNLGFNIHIITYELMNEIKIKVGLTL